MRAALFSFALLGCLAAPTLQPRAFYTPYPTLSVFAQRDRDYIAQKPALRPFFKHPTTWEGFAAALAAKQSYDANHRRVLVDVLRQQYSHLEAVHPAALANIDALTHENSFTVTTAHQPNLLLGPLFTVHKVLSTVKLALEAMARFPAYRFVPIYWMGSEDHDFEELNNANFFNKKWEWDTANAGGAIGRIPTDTLTALVEEAAAALGTGEHAETLRGYLLRAYNGKNSFGQATQQLYSDLFGAFGLVVLDQDAPALKALFAPVIIRELTEQPSEALVLADIADLEAAGYSSQATPRPINLFYLTDRTEATPANRTRITYDPSTQQYAVLQTTLTFTRTTLLEEVQNHPERFSPNVVLRPLYQEIVLPNVAYIGGGGEVAYWLERGRLFAANGVPFPLLVRRASVLWVNAATRKRVEKLGFTLDDLWHDYDTLAETYTRRVAADTDFSFEAERTALATLYEQIRVRAINVDASLEKTVQAEAAKATSGIEALEAKLLKAEKRKHETALTALQSVKEKLYPARGLQERYDNFIPYYTAYGTAFFTEILAAIQPFFDTFVTIEE